MRLSRLIGATGTGVGRVFGAIADWNERAAQRRGITAFDDRMLRDIGVSRVDLIHEAGRTFERR